MLPRVEDWPPPSGQGLPFLLPFGVEGWHRQEVGVWEHLRLAVVRLSRGVDHRDLVVDRRGREVDRPCREVGRPGREVACRGRHQVEGNHLHPRAGAPARVAVREGMVRPDRLVGYRSRPCLGVGRLGRQRRERDRRLRGMPPRTMENQRVEEPPLFLVVAWRAVALPNRRYLHWRHSHYAHFVAQVGRRVFASVGKPPGRKGLFGFCH